jgi:hypothetical protein
MSLVIAADVARRAWNGLSWRVAASLATSPTPDRFGPVVYDAPRHQLLSLADCCPPPATLADTWTWDGSSW